MNKKPTSEDLKVWEEFISSKETIENKDHYLDQKKTSIPKIRKIDLHGLSLDEANKKIEILVDKYFVEGVEKIIIITGKGLKSKTIDNPYVSKNLSILKNSVPYFINTNSKIKNKIFITNFHQSEKSIFEDSKRKKRGKAARYLLMILEN